MVQPARDHLPVIVSPAFATPVNPGISSGCHLKQKYDGVLLCESPDKLLCQGARCRRYRHSFVTIKNWPEQTCACAFCEYSCMQKEQNLKCDDRTALVPERILKNLENCRKSPTRITLCQSSRSENHGSFSDTLSRNTKTFAFDTIGVWKYS